MLEQIEEVFKVNFFGTVNSIKVCRQFFKDKKSGIITIVSSIAGYRGLPIQQDMVHLNLH